MIHRVTALALGAVAALALAASAAKADNLYIVHGIIGTDLGLSATLPVDIGLDGACTPLTGVEFGQSASAGTVAAGIYRAEVFLADGSPCGGALAVSADIEIPVAGIVFVVAHLDQNGLPTLSQFTGNVGDIGPGLAKVQAVHAAAAPAVDLRIKTRGANEKIEDLRPGDQSFAFQGPAGDYDVQVKPSAGGGRVLDLRDVPISGDALTSAFAVGSVGTGSLTVVLVEVTP